MASRRTGRITKGWGAPRRSQFRRPAGSAALERLARSRAAIPGNVSGLAASNGQTDRWWQGDGGRKRPSPRSAAIHHGRTETDVIIYDVLALAPEPLGALFLAAYVLRGKLPPWAVSLDRTSTRLNSSH